MIASSPASNWLSRTIPLKPSCAVGGPQKSNETTDELIRPCRSALVTGYSARLVRSVTTPLNGYCIRLLPVSAVQITRMAPRQRSLTPDGSRISPVGQARIERLRGAGEDPFLILRPHRGECFARHTEELGERPRRGGVVRAPGEAGRAELVGELLEEGLRRRLALANLIEDTRRDLEINVFVRRQREQRLGGRVRRPVGDIGPRQMIA